MRFFNSIQDIGNEDMQTLWGKILAGEIKNPNTFTLRSLDTLSKITKGEAMLFKNMVPYIINNIASPFVIYLKYLNYVK